MIVNMLYHFPASEINRFLKMISVYLLLSFSYQYNFYLQDIEAVVQRAIELANEVDVVSNTIDYQLSNLSLHAELLITCV